MGARLNTRSFYQNKILRDNISMNKFRQEKLAFSLRNVDIKEL
jgi:hypothetical protein|tara:strand:+ start:1130 stop:1258 length:129 start_codon:yes stop_codon:yes gene_type:complete